MKKVIVIGVIALFVGVGFTSGIGVNVEQTSFPLNPWVGAWWEFNEGSGNTAYDSTGNGYDGTVYGATWTGGGLSFDGIDNYVDFDNHSVALGMNKTDDYVIQVRFRSTGSGMLYSMSHTNPDRAYYDLMLDNEGKVGVIMGDITCTFDLFTTGSYNDGEWYLVESEFRGDTTNPTLNIYIDGELEATTTEWLCPMLDEDFLTAKVGRDSNAETDYLDGEIDDIKIYKSHEPPPPLPYLTITGPDSGKPGQELTYIFTIVDPYGNDCRCHIDWGDGNTEWVPIPDCTYVAVSHVWYAQGNVIITAYAEDEWGRYGPSTYKQLTITRNKPLNFNILKWRLNHILQILQPRSISTNDDNEVKHETTVRIHRSNGITPYTLKLTEKESDKIDSIFDNLKVSLDSAVTDEEIDEIDDAVVSLYELGMFPRMTVKEAKQLVNDRSVKSSSENMGTADENFNCQITGEASESYMLNVGSLFRGYFLLNILLYLCRGARSPFGWSRYYNFPRYNGSIGYITFGRYYMDSGIVDYYPSKGWIWTNGSNGVVEWEGKFYGDIDTYTIGEWERYDYCELIYKGVWDFEGLWVDNNFVGTAKEVRISYTPSCPSK